MRPVGVKRRREFAFIRAPLRQVMDYLDESERLSSLYSVGVQRLQGAHKLALALDHYRKVSGKDDDTNPDDRKKRLAWEKELEELATEEVSSGFRLLSAHAIVEAWGVMESAIDDWVVEWLTRRPQDLELDQRTEIKLPAASYVSLSTRERAEILFSALRERQGQSFGVGMTRFERPLALVGLSAGVPNFLSDGIFEMHKVRNTYAHCGGRADDRFIADCPWFDLSAGDVVPVNNETLHGYTNLLSLYLLLVMHRGYARVGIRLQGRELNQSWDPSVDVAGASADAEGMYCETLPPCVESLPVMRARHSDLFEDTVAAST